MKDRIEELRRVISADPKNATAQVELVKLKARLGDYDALRAPLRDRKVWQRTPEYIQDLCIEYVATKLNSNLWDHQETKTFSCVNRRKKEVIEEKENSNPRKHLFNIKEEEIEENITHRIATFVQKLTGIEFNLLPGGYLAEERLNIFETFPPFLIARTPVTNAQFDKKLQSPLDQPNCPAVGMSFHDCNSWCESNSLVLPTILEWEYAARAGTVTRFYWGENKDNGDLSSGPGEPQGHILVDNTKVDYALENKLWNSFGLTDLYGNVLEWVNRQDSSTLIGHYYFQPLFFNKDSDYTSPFAGFRPVAHFDLES